MTPYELARLVARPFLPVLYARVYRDLRRLTRSASGSPPAILDIGGRSSPYTIGLRARVTVLDLPRAGETAEALHLGISDGIRERLQERRSNIARVAIEDMTRCTLPSASFDGAVAIEALEHIAEGEAFLRQMARVLQPGAWAYLTTPNGDYVRNEPPNYNPDHLCHYTRASLTEILSRQFAEVRVVYGIRTGKHRYRGLRNLSLRHPIRSLVTMGSNVVNAIESRNVERQPVRTAHLIALARKAP